MEDTAEVMRPTLLELAKEFTGQDNRKILITGATGWVGKTAVHILASILPPQVFDERVYLFSSKHTIFQIPSKSLGQNRILPVYALSFLPEVASQADKISVFHSAFLTRDRLPGLGVAAYIRANSLITSYVDKALQISNNSRIAIISSGAAMIYKTISDARASLFQDPYGALKREEEILLSGKTSSITLRIFALSGYFMRNPERFALGDFILSAISNNRIYIRSKSNVIRGYGHASNIACLALAWLLSDHQALLASPLNTITETISLCDLAALIGSMYQLPSAVLTRDRSLQDDIYTANGRDFIDSLQQYNLFPSSLEAQVKDTYSGLTGASPDVDPGN